MVEDLRAHPRIGVDTESNNMFAYQDRVALIQFSTPQQDYIVDPFADIPVDALRDVFEDPHIEKIFHAAEYDLIGLRRDFGFRVRHLFDTMHAARVLGKPRVGLAALLQEYFGVTLDKRYQTMNWGQRPLPEDALAYAVLDTHYLISLRERLYEELVHRDLWALAREDFVRLQTPPEPRHKFDDDRFWSLPGARHLDGEALSVLKALYRWREEEAKRKNVPPFRILHNRELVLLAKVRPRTMAELRHYRTLRYLARNGLGKKILDIVAWARLQPTPQRPQRESRMPRGYYQRLDTLRQWRRGEAQARGVESDIVLPRTAMERIAEANPQSVEDLKRLDILGPVRLRMFGEAIISALRRG